MLGMPEHLLFPPLKGFSRNNAAWVTPQIPAATLLGGFIDVTHHQEKEVPHSEHITFPRALDGIGATVAMHTGILGMFPEGIYPSSEPPAGRLTGMAAVMIARNVVDGLTGMSGQGSVLAHHFSPLLIGGSGLAAR